MKLQVLIYELVVRIKVIKRLFNFRRIACFIFLLISYSHVKATTKTSTGTGNWNTAGTWSPSGVPANGDDVIIQSGHTITINANTNNLLSLTVNGALTIGNNNTNRTVTVTGNITVSSTGTFNTAGNGGNALIVGGNLANSGIFDMHTGSAVADVTFNGAANQTISGTGGTTDFDNIIINNAGAINNNMLEVMSSNFTASAGFLTLTKGILKMSGSYTFSNTFFNSASPTINSDEGIWLNNSNVTVTGQSGNISLAGLLRVSAGTFNIGTAANNSLIYSTGAVVTIDGGALNIAGLFRGTATSTTLTYTQSNGVVTVCTVGNTSSTNSSFDIRAAGSTFTMSGGTIVVQLYATIYTDFYNNSTSATITGGTIQLGNSSTAASSPFWVSSVCPIYNLVVNAANSPNVDLRVNTTVLNDITIGGTLTVASLNTSINVGHDWINNGTFTQGTGTVTFDGTATQQITGSAATTFYNFTVHKTAGGVTLNKPITIQGAGTFTSGIVTSSSTNLLTFNDNATTSGANNNATPSYVNGPVKKIGDDAFTFPVGKTGAGYRLCGISAPSSTTDAFTAEFIRASATALGPITAAGLKVVSNCEYWQLDRTTGSSTVNVTLSWNGYSNCNLAAYVTSLASLTVAHFNGTSWDTHGSNSYTGTVSSGTITRNSVSVFSPFSLGSTSAVANPLPVKFSAVEAYKVSNGNRIEWTNLTEENLARYEVERSSNGTSFNTIISVTPKTNNGLENNYTETDISVLNDVNYYRIKGVEQDGSYEYSIIVKVVSSPSGASSISVYPNPVSSNQFTLQMNSYKRGDYSVKLINSNGQIMMLKTIQHGGGSVSVSVEKPVTAQPGLYILQLTGEGTTENLKLVIK